MRRRIALRALVMDDDADICLLLVDMLGSLGIEVDTCGDGHSALALVEAADGDGRPYDFVILDLMIEGGMGGKDTVRVLKARWPRLPALVTTGYVDDPAVRWPAEYGFDGALPKPYSFAQLEAAIEWVERR